MPASCKKTFNKGFTLLELLVVVAIIGVISGIVLGALSISRARANDTRVREQLASIRNAASLYELTNANYGTPTTVCTAGMFADPSSNLRTLTTLTNYPAGTTMACNSSGNAYAVTASLQTPGTFWCIDSVGGSKQESSHVGAGVVVCP